MLIWVTPFTLIRISSRLCSTKALSEGSLSHFRMTRVYPSHSTFLTTRLVTYWSSPMPL